MIPAAGLVRVVVVDDSATRRSALAAMLGSPDSGIEIVGFASDAASALAAVQLHSPGVVTMDLEMPAGGGQSAIEQLMALRPVPILVVSSHVPAARSIDALDALAAGALDIFPWPDRWDADASAALRAKVRSLDGVPVMHHPRGARGHSAAVPSGTAVGIAASTGGPAALARVLGGLSGLRAPILVVQHLHADFIDTFVAWMTRAAAMPVMLAVDGTVPRPGVVHVAPAGRHLRVGADHRLHLDDQPARLHMPSADILFSSMATAYGAGAVGVVLTGMGDDGAEGLRAVSEAGGLTLAQDEASSAVWGMPQAAYRRGGVSRLVELDQLPAAIRRRCR